jgi:hypothetical protein
MRDEVGQAHDPLPVCRPFGRFLAFTASHGSVATTGTTAFKDRRARSTRDAAAPGRLARAVEEPRNLLVGHQTRQIADQR